MSAEPPGSVGDRLRIVPRAMELSCPTCGKLIPRTDAGSCAGCGAQLDVEALYFEEHGPEAFMPPPAPRPPTLSGLSLVAESGLVLLLAFLLYLLVRYVFGGWTWDAMLVSAVYWLAYAMVRRRITGRAWFRLLPMERSGDGESRA